MLLLMLLVNNNNSNNIFSLYGLYCDTVFITIGSDWYFGTFASENLLKLISITHDVTATQFSSNVCDEQVIQQTRGCACHLWRDLKYRLGSGFPRLEVNCYRSCQLTTQNTRTFTISGTISEQCENTAKIKGCVSSVEILVNNKWLWLLVSFRNVYLNLYRD